MNCSRFERELSQCLDGRLPSARRGAAMAHVDACPNCAEAWSGMLATQSVIADLEPHRVRPNFHNQVWDRIQAGEGASEILLKEPISAGSKIRYSLVGAAAAAVFLVALQWVVRDTDPSPTDTTATEVATVEIGSPEVGDPQIDLEPVHQDGRDGRQIAKLSRRSQVTEIPSPFATTPLTAGHLASVAVHRVTDAARKLGLYRGRILSHAKLDHDHQEQVAGYVRTIEGGVNVLEQLQRRKLLELESSSQNCLAAAQNTLRIHRGDATDRVYNLVRTLEGCQLDELNNIRYTVMLKQVDDQPKLLIEMLANDSFRDSVKSLQCIQGSGGIFSLQIDPRSLFQGNGGMTPEMMRIQFSVRQSGARQTDPAPRVEQKKQLRKRN